MKLKNQVILLLALLTAGCAKDDKTFILKTIRLNDYKQANIPVQRLYLKVLEDPAAAPIAYTGFYPSDLALPVNFKVYPPVPVTLYSRNCFIQVWGDSSGCIATCRVHMDEYKIIFPIDMEVKNDSLSLAIMGSWQ